eukprot:gene3043-2459_t
MTLVATRMTVDARFRSAPRKLGWLKYAAAARPRSTVVKSAAGLDNRHAWQPGRDNLAQRGCAARARAAAKRLRRARGLLSHAACALAGGWAASQRGRRGRPSLRELQQLDFKQGAGLPGMPAAPRPRRASPIAAPKGTGLVEDARAPSRRYAAFRDDWSRVRNATWGSFLARYRADAVYMAETRLPRGLRADAPQPPCAAFLEAEDVK